MVSLFGSVLQIVNNTHEGLTTENRTLLRESRKAAKDLHKDGKMMAATIVRTSQLEDGDESIENKTYADGSCASIYNQYPPLVNASRPPGQWQSYDILWTAPRFEPDGKLRSPARVTLFHNGVLVHNNVELIGDTGWVTRGPYRVHPEKLPISIQDHGNPVRFRNIWVRELGRPGRPEFQLADKVLEGYVGKYEVNKDWIVDVSRRDGNLLFTWAGTDFVVTATSPNRFFAKTTDVQVEFKHEGADDVAYFSVGEDGGMRAKKVK